MAVAEHRLGVSNAQLSDACQEPADTKTLFGDTHVTLFGSLDILTAQHFQISSLRKDRDNVLRALNSARDLLNSTFPVFSLDPEDQYLRAVEERDDFRAANKDYAEELRAVRPEHFACLRQLACLRAENLSLRAELDSLRPSSNP